MRLIDKPESFVVAAGMLKDADVCKSDINNGMAFGGAVGGAVFSPLGVAGASLGTLSGMAFGGGYAAANSPGCQGDAGAGRGFVNPSIGFDSFAAAWSSFSSSGGGYSSGGMSSFFGSR